MSKSKNIDNTIPPLFISALAALQRAAKNARQLAIFHNTSLIIWRDNHIVRLSPDEISEEFGDE